MIQWTGHVVFCFLVVALSIEPVQAQPYGLIFAQEAQRFDMEIAASSTSTRRYKVVSEKKASGATYTPKVLADFVARKIVDHANLESARRPLSVLDPAVGDGELLVSLLEHLEKAGARDITVLGFETNSDALMRAKERLKVRFPHVTLVLERRDFLSFVSEACEVGIRQCLFQPPTPQFDFVIANPPYVRTQVMGAEQTRFLAREFGLTGRVDLYHAFIVAIAAVLKPKGIAGVITSNRFMTTKAGASVRRAVLEHAALKHVWDLGDSKVFDAAVLPAVLIVEGKSGKRGEEPRFTSIYETKDPSAQNARDPIEALEVNGVVSVADGRRFQVRHGSLNLKGAADAVWTIATYDTDAWLATVAAHTWATFGSLGKIRVGIKTTADKIFIRNDWSGVSPAGPPELLRPLMTHRVARPFRPLPGKPTFKVLYPHLSKDGRRYAVDLTNYPRARQYLEQHRKELESRSYVIEAGRAWYEIWVPQDPAAWAAPKLVFRDISHKPTFWLDFQGSLVNGDCYWLTCAQGVDCELLWLAAAVANSSFSEMFYDHKFNNKLYSGRRRFITQYVEQFPLPNPASETATAIVKTAKEIYEKIDTPAAAALEKKLDDLVFLAFGLPIEEVRR
jgi:methylase of polypeptide subunit release factors